MYWRDETADAWRALWRDVQEAGAARGMAIPDLMAADALPERWAEHWCDADLFVSQTCSMPLRTVLRDRVTYVGTFDFGVNEHPGHYHSVLVKHAPDAPVVTLALNGYDSQSGFVAGTEPLTGQGSETAFATTAQHHLVTGAHAASLRAVALGEADGAYLDAVTWRLLKTFDPLAAGVVEAGQTRPTPGLPLITAKGRDPAPIRALLRDVFSQGAWRGAPELGGLRHFVVLDEARYHDLPVPTDQTRG